MLGRDWWGRSQWDHGVPAGSTGRRLVILFGLSLWLLTFALPVRAVAAGSTTVLLTGQIQVSGGRENPQLILNAAETDPSGWQMKATLIPTVTRRNQATAQIEGQFTMAAKGTPILDGTATGQVNLSNGQGSMVLTLADGTQANADFTVTASGDMQMNLTGALPAPAPLTPPPTNDNPLFWYLSRTAGFIAYLLLFANVCLGLSVRTGFLDESLPRWRSFDLHQFTALLATSLVMLHVFSLLGDHFIGFDLQQLLVPGIAAYRPLWTAVGILCLYGLVVVVASFYLRPIIGHKSWRALHYVTYALFFAVLAHGIFAGNDGGFWFNATCFVTGAVVVLLTLARFWGPWSIRATSTQNDMRFRRIVT